jgi:uncharacterized protein YkwD
MVFLTVLTLASCVNPAEIESSAVSTDPSTNTNPDTPTETTDGTTTDPTNDTTSQGYRPRPKPTPTSTPTTSPTPKPTTTVTPTPSPSPTQNPTGGLTGTAILDEEEWAFVTLINDYRAQNGVAKLEVSVKLTQASDWMSTDMATKSYFSHSDSLSRDPFVRMKAFGYPNTGYRGENIAAGNATASATFTQWKNSAGHNANMLSSSYRVIGVARAYNASAPYRWYWTTDFGSVVDETVK